MELVFFSGRAAARRSGSIAAGRTDFSRVTTCRCFIVPPLPWIRTALAGFRWPASRPRPVDCPRNARPDATAFRILPGENPAASFEAPDLRIGFLQRAGCGQYGRFELCRLDGILARHYGEVFHFTPLPIVVLRPLTTQKQCEREAYSETPCAERCLRDAAARQNTMSCSIDAPGAMSNVVSRDSAAAGFSFGATKTFSVAGPAAIPSNR